MTSTLLPPAPPAGAADPIGDLARAWRVWRRHPGLPLGSAAVAAAVALSAAPGPAGGLGTLVALLTVGWVGTERLWYLRAWHADGLRAGALAPATLRYLGRFLLLGLGAGVAYVLLALPAIVAVVRRAVQAAQDAAASGSTVETDGLVPLWSTAWLVGAVLVLDVLGTFITPALVYSTWRVSVAVPLGLRLLRLTWPHAALYVVVPPLALVVLNTVGGTGGWLGAGLVVVAALANLLVKGAVAAYYLRVVGTAGPHGAVKPPPYPASGAPWPERV